MSDIHEGQRRYTELQRGAAVEEAALGSSGLQQLVAATLAAGMIAGARERISVNEAVARMREVLDALNASGDTRT